MPYFTEFCRNEGSLPDDEIDNVLSRGGLEIGKYKKRGSKEKPIEQQAINRQRVLWLNNERTI